jgi:hypothetical protein
LPAQFAVHIHLRPSQTCAAPGFQTHKMKTSQRKSSLAYTSASPQKRFWLFSEQDGSASGFAWVAREPKLMCGAKGRASSLRSIDYYNRTWLRQHKLGGKINPLSPLREYSGADLKSHPLRFLLFRRSKGPFRCKIPAIRSGLQPRANP